MRKVTYPDPDDPDPTARDGTDVSEAPVSVSGDDRGNKLGDTEGKEQGDGGALHEEESVRTGDENESLGNDRNLKVDNHVEHAIVGKWDTWPVLELDTKLALEEIGLQDDNDEDDGGEGEVQAVGDGESEDFSEIPTIRSH